MFFKKLLTEIQRFNGVQIERLRVEQAKAQIGLEIVRLLKAQHERATQSPELPEALTDLLKKVSTLSKAGP